MKRSRSAAVVLLSSAFQRVCRASLPLLFLLVSLALPGLTSATARGATLYVDPVAGADTNDGLAAVFDGTHGPKLTLGAALTAVAPGDTLNVASGSYTGPFALNGITLTGLTLGGPATFSIQPEQLTVTVTAANGAVTGAGTFDRDSQITLTPTADAQWHFDHWEGDVPQGQETVHPLTFTLTANVALTAVFAPDPPLIVLSTMTLAVPEAGTNTFTVALDRTPQANVTVAVSAVAGGDADLTVAGGAELVFTTENWATPQTVTLAAAQDADTMAGTATVRANAPGLAPVDLAAAEADNDFILTLNGGTPAGATIHETLSVVNIAATPAAHHHFTGWTGDTAGITDANSAETIITLTGNASISAGSALNQHTVTGTAGAHGTVTGGGTYDYGATATLTATADAQWHFDHWEGDVPQGQEATNPLALTVTGNLGVTAVFAADPLLILLSVATLGVPEGGTAVFSVVLDREPPANLTVAVAMAQGGDADLTVQNGAELLFTPENWATAQTVMLAAAEDDTDAANGSATVQASAAGLATVTLPVSEVDNDASLTVQAGANGSVTPAGTSIHTQGSTVAIVATPDTGYRFVAWTGDTVAVAETSIASTTVQVNTGTVITATFAALTATYYVDGTAGSDANDGLAETTADGHGPKQTIGAAIAAASAGCTVVVKPGTYNECINFGGKNITVRSSDPADAAVVAATIIDGQWNWEQATVTFAAGETAATVLRGFTIRNGGLANVHVSGAAPKIVGNRILSDAMFYGQVYCTNNAAPLIEGNDILNGSIALYANGGAPVLRRNRISGNYGFSGTVYLYNAQSDVSGNRITGNQGDSAGGIYIQGGTAALANNVIAQNSSYMGGGAVSVQGGTVLLRNDTVVGNQVSNDYDTYSGGGLQVGGGTVEVRNCIFRGNGRGWGTPTPNQFAVSGGTLSVSYSDIEGGQAGVLGSVTWGAGNLDADPLFVNASAGDFHLKSVTGHWDAATSAWVTDAESSPCLDAGDPADAFALEPAPNGGRINLGADGNTVEASRSGTVPALILVPTAVGVAEGATAVFNVTLNRAPEAAVTVTAAIQSASDPDIMIANGAELVFTPENWTTAQTVTLAAANDADAANGTATVAVSGTGVTGATLTATEIDKDATLTVTGGTPAGTTVHEKGTGFAIAATPAEHYHFTIWTGDTAGIADVNAAETTITLTANASITAGSALDQYTVAATGDHATVIGTGVFDYGASALLQVTADPGWHFTGWTGAVPAGHEQDNPLALTVTGDHTLTAETAANQPQLTLSTGTVAVPEGATADFTVVLDRAPAANVIVTVGLQPDGDADLTIQGGAELTFTPVDWNVPQTVTLAAAEDDADATNGSTVLTVSAAGATPQNVALSELDNDVTLTVAGGTPAGTTVHTLGSPVAIAATPAEHYHFTAWNGDTAGIADANSAQTTIALTAAASIAAGSALDQFTLTVTSAHGDPQGAGLYDFGTQAAWSVTSPAAGPTGQRWVTAVAAGGVLMDADQTVTVDWTAEYLLTIDSAEHGTVQPEGGWCAETATATLTAVPALGWHFAAWTSDVAAGHETDNPLSLAMDQARSVTPVFARNTTTYWAALKVGTAAAGETPDWLDAVWQEVMGSSAGGWTSDLSVQAGVTAAGTAVVSALDGFAIAVNGAPTLADGFETSNAAAAPAGWTFNPAWSDAGTIRVTDAAPASGDRALRLETSTAAQGFSAAGTAVSGSGRLEFDFFLPAEVPADTGIASVWLSSVCVSFKTDPLGVPRVGVGISPEAEPVMLNQPLVAGAWNHVVLFLGVIVDTDSDGMDDAWEIVHFGNLNQNGTGDFDNDGLANLYEFRAGLDPTMMDTDGDGMSDGWEVAHQLDAKHNTDAAGDADNDGLSNLAEFNAGTNPSSTDTDSDGLSDYVEMNTYGTSPILPDTNSDGLSDGASLSWGVNPAAAPAVLAVSRPVSGTILP